MTVWLLYGLLFLVVAYACHALILHSWPRAATQRLQRLRHAVTRPDAEGSSVKVNRGVANALATRLADWRQPFDAWLLRFGQRLKVLRTEHTPPPTATTDTVADAPADTDRLRRRLLNAGIPSAQAVVMFQAMQALLALLLPLLAGLFLWIQRPALQTASQLIVLILAGMVGYQIPRALLERRIRRRQALLLRHFPDALDLMRMCIQAGLGLDASLDRVGRETRLSCPALSEELAMTGYELRAGASRAQALRHMAERMDLRDVDAWVNTLIQSDRFGTSISESLQVYAQALRHKRQLTAQEAAAKLPIKLLVPLVFCLFPGLLVVLLGPAIINISTHLLPVLSGRP